MWPFRRRTRREPARTGNGEAGHAAVAAAQRGLTEALRQSREVDQLAREIRKALGVHR